MTVPDFIEIYDRRPTYYSPIRETPIQNLAALVGVDDLPGPILDVGCGAGYLAQWVGNVVGVDYSQVRVTLAKRNHPDDEWICADAFDWLATTDRRFKSAVMCEVLEHTTDPRRLVDLTRAVTDGPVVGTVPLGIDEETHMFDWRTLEDVTTDLAPYRIHQYDRHAVVAWVPRG